MDDEEAIIRRLDVIEKLDLNQVSQHLFCQDADTRKQALDCLPIFGYDGDNAKPRQEAFGKILDTQLGICVNCLVEYYQGKREWIRSLGDSYEEEDIADFVNLLNGKDYKRIIHGLENAKKTLKDLPPEKRRFTNVKGEDLLAVFEALTSEDFLLQDILLKDHFNETFEILQTHKDLLINNYVPAVTQFLFSDNGRQVTWATNNWKPSDPTKGKKNAARMGQLTRKDFEFAVKRPLNRAMERLADQLNNNWDAVTGPRRLERFWTGIDLIIARIDGETITHGLRAMEQSVHLFVLDWLRLVDQPGLLRLLSAVRGLLVKGPKDFWTALGAISAKALIEGIFNAPAFIPAMSSMTQVISQETLQPLLGWVTPLLESLAISHKSEATEALVTYLMSTLQTSQMPVEVRAECYRIGLEAIATSLAGCCESESTLNGVGRLVASNHISTVVRHIQDVVSPLEAHSVGNSGTTDIVSLCKQVLSLALRVEVECLAGERHEIHNAETLDPTFQVTRLRVWPAISNIFDASKIELVPICIEAVTHFVALEVFESKQKDLGKEQQREDFNNVLKTAHGYIDKIFRALADVPTTELTLICSKPEVATHIIRTLFLYNEDNYAGALDLVKSISGESFRSDAIAYFIRQSFDQVILGVMWASKRVASAKAFHSAARWVKILKNIIDGLCNDHHGYLTGRLLPTTSSKILQGFWTKQWHYLGSMYANTQGWSVHFKLDPMQEFCRDVIDYTQILFDQFPVIESAVQSAPSTTTIDLTEDDDANGTSFTVLEAPCANLKHVTSYLKLRDPYLLDSCVKLTWKLLTELTRRKIELPASTSNLLERILSNEKNGIKTILTRPQKAEIRRLLEDNLGHSLPASREASVVRDEPEVFKNKSTSSKQGTIDLKSWPVKEKEATPIVERPKPLPKPAQKPNKTTTSALSSRSNKVPAAVDKAAQEAQRQEFLKKREEAKLEQQRRDAAVVAKARGNRGTIAGLTAGEGSALGNIGKLGKEHYKTSDIMVDSDSEDDSEDDDWSTDLLKKAAKTSASVDAYNASKKAQMKQPQQPVKKIKQIRTKHDLRARVAPDLSSIHASMLSWNFFHDSDLPPGSNRDNYAMVTSTFKSAYEYRKTFEPLLLLEAWQSFRQAREEANEKVFALKIVSRISQDNLYLVSATLELTSAIEKPPFEGDILLLSKADKPSQTPAMPSCMARVMKTTRKPQIVEITLRVAIKSNPIQDLLGPNISLNCEKVNSVIPLEREYGALLGLEYYDLCDEIVRAYPSPLMTYSENILAKTMGTYNLNQAQAKAVKSSVDNDGFTLIQGPPGSGKTKTIVAIVGALLSDVLVGSGATGTSIPISNGAAGQSRAVPKKLLVCAPSNAAVDELVMRFMQGVKTSRGDLQKPSIVRLGKSDNINDKVMEVTLDELVKQKMDDSPADDSKGQSETHKAMMEHKATCDEINTLFATLNAMKKDGQAVAEEMYHRLEVLKRKKQSMGNQIDRLKDGTNRSRDAEVARNKIRQEIIDGAHILCATLSGSGHELFRGLSIDFDTVIIDEAAQSIELSALIPLKYGCSKCIMVGDPKQLPPTVLSREASKFQYEQSLFVRMQANSPNDVHLLDTQYRMHPEISVFPSQSFYDGKLLDGPDMAKLTARPWHQDPVLSPYQFFDVKGMHQSGPVGHSLINRAEIDIAVRLYQRLKNCAPGYKFRGKVGIITPYKSQLKELRSRFRRDFGEDITKIIDFNTTDAFQGRESEVIIFSCVRASGKGIGFLSDIRRMNVGITRAKSSLWVLGNSTNLMQGEFWSKMIRDATNRRRFTSDTEGALNQPVTRVKVEDGAGMKEQKIKKEIQDVEMEDAPPLKRKSSMIDIKPLKNGDHDIKPSNKRPLQSPTEPSKPPKSIKTEDHKARTKIKVDTDAAQPQFHGNSALSPKPITAKSAAAPRSTVNGGTNHTSAVSGLARPRPRPPQANKAESAFIKRKPPKPAK